MHPVKRLLKMAVPVFVGLALAAVMLWLLPGAAAVRANASALFVKPAGSGTACTQATPCTLPTALGKAVNGDSLYLGAGTYTGVGSGAVVSLTKSLVLLGGWNGAAAGAVVRDPRANVSTLDGQLQRRVLYINSGLTVTLEGMTIYHGKVVGDGGGLYADAATLTLRAMILASNVATNTDYVSGGGALVAGGSLVMEDSLLEHNWTWAKKTGYGGGLAISRTLAVTITGCTFAHNDSWNASALRLAGAGKGATRLVLSHNSFISNGLGSSPNESAGGSAGALSVADATALIEDNVLRGNRGLNNHGAIFIGSCDLILNGNHIVDNRSHDVSALGLYYVLSGTLTNNVIADNELDRSGSAAIAMRQSNLAFTNNTIAGNAGGSAFLIFEGSWVTLTNTSLVSHTTGISTVFGSRVHFDGTLWGAGPWATGTWWGGDGTVSSGLVNVIGLPQFVNPAAGDYGLLPDSAAIDAGVPNGAMVDMDGKVRPWGAGWDIGAYEYRPSGVYRLVDLPLLLRLR